MIKSSRSRGLHGSTALLALAACFAGLAPEAANAACTTGLVPFPAQPLPSGQSYITITSTGVIVPSGTTIVSNTTALNGGDGIHIVPFPGGAAPFAVNNGNGCIETRGTVNITVGGLAQDHDGIRVIAADPAEVLPAMPKSMPRRERPSSPTIFLATASSRDRACSATSPPMDKGPAIRSCIRRRRS